MKILPINNTQTNTQFKAKFSQKDIKTFLKEASVEEGPDTISALYTMLEFIKKQSGKAASIKQYGLWSQIHIDGKSMNNERKYFCAMHALQDATVNHKNTLLKETPIKRLSEDEFEYGVCKNAKKTKQDIERMF